MISLTHRLKYPIKKAQEPIFVKEIRNLIRAESTEEEFVMLKTLLERLTDDNYGSKNRIKWDSLWESPDDKDQTLECYYATLNNQFRIMVTRQDSPDYDTNGEPTFYVFKLKIVYRGKTFVDSEIKVVAVRHTSREINSLKGIRIRNLFDSIHQKFVKKPERKKEKEYTDGY